MLIERLHNKYERDGIPGSLTVLADYTAVMVDYRFAAEPDTAVEKIDRTAAAMAVHIDHIERPGAHAGVAL